MTKFYSNRTRLFVRNSIGGIVTNRSLREQGLRYLHHTGVWRILWNGGRQRVILREHWTPLAFLSTVKDSDSLDMLLIGGVCADPTNPDEGEIVAQLIGCKRNRSWLPFASAIAIDDAGVLDLWVEFDCLHVEITGGGGEQETSTDSH